jgi:hypothetical protein
MFQEPSPVYRPWAAFPIPALAAQYTAERRYFLGTYGAVVYLGERVAIQHSSDTFVVPAPPPRHMFHDALQRDRAGGPSRGTPWRSHVLLEQSYEEDLLPLLAPAPVPSEEAAVCFYSFSLSFLGSPQVSF